MNLGRPSTILSATKNINNYLKNPAITQICLRNESTKVQPTSQNTNVDGLIFFYIYSLQCITFMFYIMYKLYMFLTEIPYRPYSPFQKTNNTAEYAVARLDDVLNWGRKVIKIYIFIIFKF